MSMLGPETVLLFVAATTGFRARVICRVDVACPGRDTAGGLHVFGHTVPPDRELARGKMSGIFEAVFSWRSSVGRFVLWRRRGRVLLASGDEHRERPRQVKQESRSRRVRTVVRPICCGEVVDHVRVVAPTGVS